MISKIKPFWKTVNLLTPFILHFSYIFSLHFTSFSPFFTSKFERWFNTQWISERARDFAGKEKMIQCIKYAKQLHKTKFCFGEVYQKISVSFHLFISLISKWAFTHYTKPFRFKTVFFIWFEKDWNEKSIFAGTTESIARLFRRLNGPNTSIYVWQVEPLD